MRTIVLSSLHVALALVAAPLLQGVINRTKAILAGRHGQPILQGYSDILKLLRKGAVYSRTTTWLFRAGPIINLVTIAVCLLLIPFGGSKAVLAFDGDLVLFAYLLGLGRFFVVAAALDTGSSFEGMGASREVTFSMLAEPTLFIGLFALSRLSSSMSLSGILYSTGVTGWSVGAPVLVSGAFFVLYLSENARIPVDDPTTHLELTMIHEVMVLDHGGPDFALVSYGVALKLWLLGMLLVGVFSPNLAEAPLWFREGYALLGMFVLSVGVGVVESLMARVRLLKVPQLLIGAAALSMLAVILVLE